jgi:hypothetical protein
MARPSPLRSAQANAVSVCGKLLQKGQSITVKASAVGPREKTLQARGKIAIRKSNKDGHVQIVCLLK